MVPSEASPYDRIVRRITWAMVVIGAFGTAAASVRLGWKFGVGFLLGAGLSYLSFWRWQRVVEALGAPSQGRLFVRMAARFLGLAAIAYGIVKYLEVNPVALFLGLLVSAAAVIVSILFELIYAGT